MFLTPLSARKVAEAGAWGRARWMLTAPLVFESELIGEVIVPAEFITDFASVPRIPGAYWLTGDSAHAAAVVHDWLCTDSRSTWATAAKVFREAMKAEGVPGWRAWLMYMAVRLAEPRFHTGEPL